jgi:hypothetical protein
MLELKDACNAMWQGQVYKGCICGYTIYKLDEGVDYDYASSIVYGVRTMCELILYLKSEIEKFHKLRCIKGDCNNCGISKLKYYPRDNFILGRWIPTTRCSYFGSGLRMFTWVILMMEVTNMQYSSNAR